MEALASAELEFPLCVVREDWVSMSSTTLLPLPAVGEGSGEGGQSVGSPSVNVTLPLPPRLEGGEANCGIDPLKGAKRPMYPSMRRESIDSA